MADAIAANAASITEANQEDLDSSGLTGAMRDRLLLTPERIAAMVSGVREVAESSGSGRVRPSRSGPAPTVCASAKCACLWAWWASSTNRGRM